MSEQTPRMELEGVQNEDTANFSKADWIKYAAYLKRELAALEQKRREDVRKCETLCRAAELSRHAERNKTEGLIESMQVWAQESQCSSLREQIRAAFPDVFKE